MTSELEIRYAQSDADVVAIHGFLCVVAGPALPGQIDPKASAIEVWRVVNHEAAVMAIRGDRLVGTIGIIQAPSWWNPKVRFLTNRWCHCLPGSGALKPLLAEATEIAKANEQEFILIDEAGGRVVILNKKKRVHHVLRQYADLK